jgi:hypothetical protein
MSEFRDDLISEALGEFYTSEAGAGQPSPGAHMARATVARRRKVRITTLSVLGALLVIVPIAAFAANPRGNSSPPDIAATPTVTAESPSPSPTPVVPQKPIRVEDLVAAKMPIPKFSASSCKTTIGPKSAEQAENDVFVEKLVVTNLDGDAEEETAAWVRCNQYEVYLSQVVGYERDAAGEIVSLGAVVKEPPSPNDFTALEGIAGGGLLVTLEYDPQSAEPDDPEGQRRTFAWRDGVFRQIDGPTEFKRANADLKLTVIGDLIWPKAGESTATLKLKVENKGPEAGPQFVIMFALDGLSKVVGEGGNPSPLRQPGLKAGEAIELTLTLTLDPSANPVDPYVQVFSFITDRTNDNTASITVVRQ